MSFVAKSTCRACSAYCPIEVTIDAGQVVKVDGNPDAPLYEGFICPKGRALTAVHNDPQRLLHSLKRMPDGSYRQISSVQLVDEISNKLRNILDKHWPRSVATYIGGVLPEQYAFGSMMISFLGALGSDSLYGANTIDQPGHQTAGALHGSWAGGHVRPEKCEVFLLVGGNPIISKQFFSQNPGQQLKRLIKGGMKLIVIDPRRTETARRAHVHLQCIPGEDPTIMAGLIHLIIENGAVDTAFTQLNTVGLERLSDAVSTFTPDYVADRAGIDEQALRVAARIIGEARSGDFGSGVGPSMATRGTLTDYLILCLQTLRGFWPKEGDQAAQPRVLLPRKGFKAQPMPPTPAWGFGRKMRVRGLQETVAGLPTGALPEEILTPGEGQVRALFLGGGAMLTWPQQDLAKKALESLDLLVVHDVAMSATARVASYVIATKKQFEVPVISQYTEVLSTYPMAYGGVEPYAAYHPALLDPPEGSDLLESWQIYYRVAQRLGLRLKFCDLLGDPKSAPPLDMAREPSTDDLYELMCANSAVPLSEVKRHPNGKVFDEAREVLAPRDAECTARLELANPDMLEELRDVRTESVAARRGTTREFPFLYIPRRVQNVTNSHRDEGALKTSYNPAYMHSSDLKSLGVEAGDMVEIRSRHGAIIGVIDIDNDLRPGVLSMSHGFGKNPGEAYDPRRDGANVNRLLHWEDDYDRHNGMPRMSAVPIAVNALSSSSTAAGHAG